MKRRETMALVEGWVVTMTSSNGFEADLSLDGGETTAYFLTEMAARVAGRRHVAKGDRWRPRYAWGYYPRGEAPKPAKECGVPWWQNDGPEWFTRADCDVPSRFPSPKGLVSLADEIDLERRIVDEQNARARALGLEERSRNTRRTWP